MKPTEIINIVAFLTCRSLYFVTFYDGAGNAGKKLFKIIQLVLPHDM